MDHGARRLISWLQPFWSVWVGKPELAWSMRATLNRIERAYRCYRRPIWMKLQRALRFKTIRIASADGEFRFRCRAGADRMFPEVFLAAVYDIPLAPVRGGDLVIDVGANHGFAAARFASRGADVLAFEPARATFMLLRENLKANCLEDRVVIECAAVTDRDGEAELFGTDRMGGGMSSLEGGYVRAAGVPVSLRESVPTRSISGVLERLGARPIRLLKLDCEGSELGILRSLGKEERTRIESIAVECHPGAYELDELVNVLMGWPEYSVSRAEGGAGDNVVLHLVREDVVCESLRALPGLATEWRGAVRICTSVRISGA